MNILVTGCNGQLGSEIRLLEPDYPQHRFFNTDKDGLDVTDALAVGDFVSRHEIDGIINCAAYTAVDRAETDRRLCTALNAEAPALLAAAIERRGGWMVHVSTDYVFNGTGHVPYTEEDTPCPDSVYGSTKLAGELAVSRFCKRCMIVRTAWLYSEFGGNFVKTMLRLGREKTAIGVVADQIGTPTYALDLAQAILVAVEKGVRPGVYHYTDEGVCSWYDFTKTIHRMAGITTCRVSPLHTAEYPTAAARPHYSVLDKTKIKAGYGLEIPYWVDSLAKCMANMNELSPQQAKDTSR